MEEAGVVTPGSEPETGDIEKRGYYEYQIDGIDYRVEYVADRNGVQATGDHLPRDPAHDQLRQDHPELFWAETGGVALNNQQPQFAETGGVVLNNQQPQFAPQFVRQNNQFSF